MEYDKTLHEAVEREDAATIEWLIANGASVNAMDWKQLTPLHHAAERSHTEAIEILLSHGADPFATNAGGQTPLHVARYNALPVLMNHMCGLCECREQHGVDPSQINAADPWGQTPFQCSFEIAPFTKFSGQPAGAPVLCFNVIDCQGSAEVSCGSGQPLKAVLQLPLDLANVKVEDNEDHKLTRVQTHVLRHLLWKDDAYTDDLPPIVDRWLDFVFGSVIKRDVEAICSFPCNYAHDLQEMEDILSIKDDPEGLCRHLMDSSIGRCDMESEESMSVTAEVESFLHDLSVFFSQRCPLLQFQCKRVGSSAEDTKTGRPDEFDVLLHYTELSKYVEVAGSDSSPLIEWKQMDADVEQEMVQCSPLKDNITLGVKVKTFQLITDFLAEKKSWGKLSFICLKQFRKGFSTILRLSNMDYSLNIKVDLVPLLSHQQRWYVFHDVTSSDADASESFALMELEHMKSLPSSAREGYVMAKSLRNVHLLGHLICQPILSDLVDRVLPSHALKHALFHAFDKEKSSLKPHEWAQRIFVQMSDHFLRSFFSPNQWLLSFFDNPHQRQKQLNLFIQRKRSDLQVFPTWIEDESRERFIYEILSILN